MSVQSVGSPLAVFFHLLGHVPLGRNMTIGKKYVNSYMSRELLYHTIPRIVSHLLIQQVVLFFQPKSLSVRPYTILEKQ